MENNDIRIITFVTNDYRKDSTILTDSLKDAGLPLSIFRIYNAKMIMPVSENEMPDDVKRKLWNVNCNNKPAIIRNALDFFNEPVLWYTDWDSELIDPDKLIRETLEWFNANDFDIGLNLRLPGTDRVHFNGGSIFIRNCDTSRVFLDEWIRMLENDMRSKSENEVLNVLATGIYRNGNEYPARVCAMPFEYCRIFDGQNEHEDRIRPVWLHKQYSRKYNPLNPQFKKSKESVETRDEKMLERTAGNTREIFQSDFAIDKDSVCIVGTAGSGKDLWDLIPDDSYKIALNAAITIPGIDFDAWCCVDPFIPGKPYFNEYLEKFKGVKLFKFQPDKDIDYIKRKYEKMGYEIFECINTMQPEYPDDGDNVYLLNCLYSFADADKPPVKGELRNGATVAGFALQIAWYYGIKTVYFHGVEMSGNQYSVEKPNIMHEPIGVWDNVRCMNTFVSRIKQDGVKIISLTKTAIEGIS